MKEIAGNNYDSSMYIKRIKEKLMDSDIELIYFKDSVLFHKEYIGEAIELIVGIGGKSNEQVVN